VAVSPRYRGQSVGDLGAGTKLVCAGLGVPESVALSEDALDVSGWRGGGLAFIGSATLE